MSFINDCCRSLISSTEGESGERLTCPACWNQFVHDGERWRNIHELGSRKVHKLTQIQRINQLTRGLD